MSAQLRAKHLLAVALLGICLGGTLAVKEQINLDAFGGDPVVSSEVGAEPSDPDDPELLMPTGTCEMPGIQVKECTHDCVYNCRDPMCTWGCVCSCNTRGAKSKLLAFLRQQVKSTQILASQKKLSKAVTAMEVTAEEPAKPKGEGFLSNPLSGIKFPKKAGKKKGVNPRFMGHKAAQAKAHRRQRNPYVDMGNFDWGQYDTAHRQEDPSLRGYAAESATINDVFDPMEDPYNRGDGGGPPKGRWWAHDTAKQGFVDNWWDHQLTHAPAVF